MNIVQTPATVVRPAGRVCPRCGAAQDGFGPEGLCPACLLRAGLEGEGSNPEVESTLLVSRRFGDYKLLEEIARGGMGVIFKARQLSLNRIVAVKMVLRGEFASVADLARFRAEAETVARLQHPNIVAIHEVGESEGQPFFSMDYIEGQNLAQLVGNTPLPAARAAKYLKTIAEAVQYAHQQGVLHRDLKPSNVLIDAGDQPRVTDFGLAKRVASTSASGVGTPDLTLTGQVLGSPNFMPPEQAAGKNDTMGPASDVYSLGAMLYHALTGRPPFVAESVTATLRLVSETEPVSPRLLVPTVPRDLETICLKCLQKEPRRRYDSAGELAAELGRFLRNEPIHARSVGKAGKVWRWCRRNRGLSTAGAVAVVLLLMLAIGAPIATLRINRARKQAEATAEENRQNLYAARIKVAEQTFKDSDVLHAVELLDSLRPPPGLSDLRSFDWYYLQQLCHSERLTLTHPKRAFSVVFSPDGSLVATAGEDGIVRLWNATNGLERARLTGHTGSVAAVVFAPDGKSLASAGADATVHVWDVATAKLRKRLQAGTNSFSALAFSPDGNLLVAGEGMVAGVTGTPFTRYAPFESPGHILFWDVNSSFELSRNVAAHSNGVRALAFSLDGRALASGGIDRSVKLIQVATGKVLASQTNFSGPVFGVAFSADGRELAAASWFPYHESGEIKVLEAATLAEKRLLSANAGRVLCLTVSPDRKKIATAGADYSARVWDFETGDEMMAFHGHKKAIYGLAFDPTGETLATAGWDTTVKLWDLNNSPVRQRIPTAQSYSVAFSPDGSLLACGGTGVELREASTGKLLATLPGYTSSDIKIAFTPDGQTLVAVGNHGTVGVFDVRTRQPRHFFQGHTGRIWCLAISPDGKTFATGGNTPDSTVKFWDIATGTLLQTFVGHTNHVCALAYSPDGRVVVSGTWLETKLWDMATGKLLKSEPGITARLLISPDGKIVASGTFIQGIRLRDLATLRELAKLVGHKDEIYDLAFSHDNRLLASASWDGTVKLWQVSSGQELLTIPSRSGVVWCVAFSPDDRTLAFGSGSTIKGSGEVTILRAANALIEQKVTGGVGALKTKP